MSDNRATANTEPKLWRLYFVGFFKRKSKKRDNITIVIGLNGSLRSIIFRERPPVWQYALDL
jgi:hypothetical protein